MSEKSKVHIIVSGRVQGVFFRDFTRQQASGFGLTGWVKNMLEGKVEIVAEGDKDKLLQLIEAVKVGPSSAKVKDCQIKWLEFSGEFRDFEIIYWE